MLIFPSQMSACQRVRIHLMHGAARCESAVQMSTRSNPSLSKCGNCADKPRCSNIITGLAQHFYHRRGGGGGFLQTNRTVPSLVFLYIYTFMSVCSSTHILSQQYHTSDRRSSNVLVLAAANKILAAANKILATCGEMGEGDTG
jgi:hypothetical protein